MKSNLNTPHHLQPRRRLLTNLCGQQLNTADHCGTSVLKPKSSHKLKWFRGEQLKKRFSLVNCYFLITSTVLYIHHWILQLNKSLWVLEHGNTMFCPTFFVVIQRTSKVPTWSWTDVTSTTWIGSWIQVPRWFWTHVTSTRWIMSPRHKCHVDYEPTS